MKKLFNLASCLLLSVTYLSTAAYGSNPINDDTYDKFPVYPIHEKNEKLVSKKLLQNEDGYLIDENGSYIMGWPVDPLGKILPKIDTKDLTTLNKIDISDLNSILGFANSTTVLEIKCNLPSDNILMGQNLYIDSLIYDSWGKEHTLTIKWTKINETQYNAALSCPTAHFIRKDSKMGLDYTKNPMTILFNQGTPLSFDNAASPPKAYIAWNSQGTDETRFLGINIISSLISLNLGTIGMDDGITCGPKPFYVSKNCNDGELWKDVLRVKIDDKGYVCTELDDNTTVPFYYIPNMQ